MPRTTSPRRTARVLLAGLAASLTLTGCGFDAPTLRPYTPSFGTNVDAPGVKVRNLLVVARPDGHGVVSASLQADEDNELSDLAARPLLGDDSPGEPLSVRGDRVALPAGELVVLSDQPNPIVLGGDFGTDTNIRFTLVFVSGATVDVIAPVVSSDNPVFATVTPAPTPTPTPTASATATPTPQPAASPSA